MRHKIVLDNKINKVNYKVKKIQVALKENSYSIFIGIGILNQLEELLDIYKINKNILFIVDKNAAKEHPGKFEKLLQIGKRKVNIYYLEPGERSKSYTELNKIYSFLLNNNYGRDTAIAAIGGGVTGDLAGYAAATFMRGVQLIHIPTTLLAAVDSSIGGKTGINFDKKKNMIGSFYQPKFVLTDIELLKTLPRSEVTSGLGEVIKYAFLSDRKFYSFIADNFSKIYEFNNDILLKIIYDSASIKAAVVSQDEKESGLRKILNLGHTFAHAFETKLNFKIKHGEAVDAGIIAALFLSNNIGILESKLLKELLSLPLKIKVPQKLRGLDKGDLIKIMLHDKKSRSERIKFVLLSDIGRIVLDAEAKDKAVIHSLTQMENVI